MDIALRSIAEAKKKLKRHYLLYDLFHSISSSLDPHKALNLIIDAAVKITGAKSGSLILIDWTNNILNIKVSRGFVQHIGDVKIKVGEGITGWVALSGEPLLLADVSRDHRYIKIRDEIKSELAVPLVVDNKIIGVLNVDSDKTHAFSQEDLNLLTLLSKQSAQVIKNGQLFDTVRRKAEELSTLIDINKTIASTLSLESILNQIVERTAKLINAKICALFLLTENGDELVLKAHYGGSIHYTRKPNLNVSQSLIGKVIEHKKPVEILDVVKAKGYYFKDIAIQEKLKSMLSVPLVVKEKAIGLINIYIEKSHRFLNEEKALVRTFADLCAIAIENAQLYEKMILLEEETRRVDRMAAVGELAIGIAHEIRNPLTIVKMIFESGSRLDDKDKQIISEELSRMNTIITHLLDYTRPTEHIRESCDIKRLIDNVFLLLSHEFQKKKIVFTNKSDKSELKISADPVQIQQVLLNLLLNASEALTEKGEILIEAHKIAHSSIEILIKDNGTGITEDLQKKLFVPFTTTKPKGLGLGLSIVKRIIIAHGGTIDIESKPQKGTSVKICLPVGI
jgi:signal transduction histidine kinase